jgi:DNA-binding transcriptional ArsR family regulator
MGGMRPARSSAASGDADAGPATDAVLRALADPQRRQILHLVRGGELAAGQIAQHFEVTQQAVSHHLQVLARAVLLHERREGTRRLYALDPQALAPVSAMLTDLWPDALSRLRQVVEQGRGGQNRTDKGRGSEVDRAVCTRAGRRAGNAPGVRP